MTQQKPTLYYFIASMPSRACLILASILDIPLNLKTVNLFESEQFSDWYRKINPVKKVPVFVDGDFTLTESRAILTYLVETRKPGSSLYPKDINKRARIDERLYYDGSTFFPKIANLFSAILFNKPDEDRRQATKELITVLKTLEIFLSESEYFAGNEITLADISILPNVATAIDVGIDITQFTKLNQWYQKMQKIPGNNHNADGSKLIREVLGPKSKL